MSRINSNIGSLISQRVLGQQNKTLSQSLERLSTGLAINRGADNPAGLIASEKLRSEEASITAAIGNAERADQVANIAEGGLQEINSLLLEVQSLVGQSANEAGLSTEEKAANQLQIDSILQTIDRIAATTSFEGVKLLNGTYDFNITGQHGRVQDFQINAAKLQHNETRAVNLVVNESAEHGALFLSAGGTALDLAAATSSFVFEIAGSRGSREFTFASGTTLASIASAVNTFKSVTGVSAVASGNYLEIKSTEFGSDNFVAFKLVNRGGQAGAVFNASSINENTVSTTGPTTFAAITNAIKDSGRDIAAIVNGITATGNGRSLRVNTDILDLNLTLSANGAQTLGAFTAFTITGGGGKFNLGPTINVTNQVSLGIKNVASRNLGSVDVGYLKDLASGQNKNVVDGDLQAGQEVVNAAIDQVTKLRGRIGAFQKNVVGATIRSLGVALENTSAAESVIRDTDFAAETARLTRSQILVQAATNILGIANARPQSVLSLLQG